MGDTTDRHLEAAVLKAKHNWGSGWGRLGLEQQVAAVALEYLIGVAGREAPNVARIQAAADTIMDMLEHGVP